MRWKLSDWEIVSWLLIAVGCAAIVLLSAISAYAYSDRYEEHTAPECQDEVWELFIDGDLVPMTGDMDQIECSMLADEIDPQTRPFADIQCRKRFVCRQGA
jgi:hypothetical protein